MSAPNGFTPTSELEQAMIHLLRAKELGAVYHYPDELIDRIDLIKRATATVLTQVIERKALTI